jgi:hypothetical protein
MAYDVIVFYQLEPRPSFIWGPAVLRSLVQSLNARQIRLPASCLHLRLFPAGASDILGLREIVSHGLAFLAEAKLCCESAALAYDLPGGDQKNNLVSGSIVCYSKESNEYFCQETR